MVTELS